MLGTKVKSPTGEDRTYYIPITGRALYPLNTPKQLSSVLGDNCLFVFLFFFFFLVFRFILELKNVLSQAKPTEREATSLPAQVSCVFRKYSTNSECD